MKVNIVTLYNAPVVIKFVNRGAKNMSNGKAMDATLIATIMDQVTKQGFPKVWLMHSIKPIHKRDKKIGIQHSKLLQLATLWVAYIALL